MSATDTVARGKQEDWPKIAGNAATKRDQSARPDRADDRRWIGVFNGGGIFRRTWPGVLSLAVLMLGGMSAVGVMSGSAASPPLAA